MRTHHLSATKFLTINIQLALYALAKQSQHITIYVAPIWLQCCQVLQVV